MNYEYAEEGAYQSQYNQFVYKHCIISQHNYEHLEWEEAKAYAYIRMIEKVDEIFPAGSSEDYVQLMRELIEKKDMKATLNALERILQHQ